MPQKWGFSPICDPPRFFFKNRALSLLYPYGALTSCKKLEKSLERSLRYLKTDHGPRTNRLTDGRTDMGDYIGPLSGKPGVQNGGFPPFVTPRRFFFEIFFSASSNYTQRTCCPNFKSFRLLHHSAIMQYHTKKSKKRLSLKKGVWPLLYSPNQNFSLSVSSSNTKLGIIIPNHGRFC